MWVAVVVLSVVYVRHKQRVLAGGVSSQVGPQKTVAAGCCFTCRLGLAPCRDIHTHVVMLILIDNKHNAVSSTPLSWLSSGVQNYLAKFIDSLLSI